MKECDLRAGVYEGKSGNKRTLLTVVGRTCVYAFSAIDRDPDDTGQAIGVTTCSARTFAQAVGDAPSIEFSPEETRRLLRRSTAMRPRRRCNKVERALFFPAQERKSDVTETQVGPAAPAVENESTEPSRNGFMSRLTRWCRVVFARMLRADAQAVAAAQHSKGDGPEGVPASQVL